MRGEDEIKSKRAYWSGVYYALDPAERHKSEKSQTVWLTAEVWLTALDWILGQTTDSATTIEPGDDDPKGWDT
jgi:hypothetical protein